MKFGEGKKLTSGGAGVNTSEMEINLSKLSEDQTIRVRLLGGVRPDIRYWVKNMEGKDRPLLTPFFDKNSESIDWKDPLFSMKDCRKEFFYTINCIDRTDGKVKILILKKKLYQYIYGLATNDEYGDPTDPLTGYDISITKKKTGPAPINVAYEAMPSRKETPLTEEEKLLELHDLDELYKPMEKEQYVQWCMENIPGLAAVNTEPYGEPAKTDGPDDIPF